MLWFNSKSAIETGVPQRANELIIQMIKDLENTSDIYNGYSYVRTMRNILVGKKHAAIAPYFRDKPYYGQFRSLKLETLEQMLDTLVHTNQIDVLLTEHGKLYCTHDYHAEMCKKKQ